MGTVHHFPVRQNTIAVLPHKKGFEVVHIDHDGQWTYLGVLPDLRQAKAWGEVQAFRIGPCKLHVIHDRRRA